MLGYEYSYLSGVSVVIYSSPKAFSAVFGFLLVLAVRFHSSSLAYRSRSLIFTLPLACSIGVGNRHYQLATRWTIIQAVRQGQKRQ